MIAMIEAEKLKLVVLDAEEAAVESTRSSRTCASWQKRLVARKAEGDQSAAGRPPSVFSFCSGARPLHHGGGFAADVTNRENESLNATIYTLKQQKAAIMRRLLAFNRRFNYGEPTPAELMTFERDKQAVMAINAAIEREDTAPRRLTLADIEAQVAALLRDEQEAIRRHQPRRR